MSTDEADLDLVAVSAGVGAVAVHEGHQEMQIVVERTAQDASNMASTYGAFGGGLIEIRGPVVIAYTKAPSPEEYEPVAACLDEQGVVSPDA